MDISEFKAGTYRRGRGYSYFLPEKVNHAFSWNDEIINELLERASLRLGEMNSFSRFVLDPDMFIKMHVIKEAVYSSRIEGTQTNIEEAVMEEKEVDPERRNDWLEVDNYVKAMNGAIEELKTLPLSNRLIRNTHRILLASGRGTSKAPGEFRTSQNWIGGATMNDAVFIPPAPEELPDLLGDLESFLHNGEVRLPHLIRVAIAHYQFETIHPFLDGNGRVGRLLITLYLVSNGILGKPLLYLSDYFNKNRDLYFDNLELVRTKNNLAQWLKFFLAGIIQTAEKGAAVLFNIMELRSVLERDRISTMGKRSRQAGDFFTMLFTHPVVTVKDVERLTGLSKKAANDLVQAFMDNGILFESTGFQRNRVFHFEEYLRMFK
jgi:Fic family protein